MVSGGLIDMPPPQDKRLTPATASGAALALAPTWGIIHGYESFSVEVQMCISRVRSASALGVVLICLSQAACAVQPDAQPAESAAIVALQARMAELEKRLPPPELGQQMLELQIRHDRLWWAGKAGNWNLAYFMVGELGEALRGIEQTNGDAAELQPQKLSEVMPSVMTPAIKTMQEALAKHDRTAFVKAYDQLSAACSSCHQLAGSAFLHIERPKTPLLDNLRYAPPARR
ncbi:MAG: hypothetical protein JSR49_12350 [Proteobacteria bacterium]|nr:hypothetical protein [Pseudomonadota bacterium]